MIKDANGQINLSRARLHLTSQRRTDDRLNTARNLRTLTSTSLRDQVGKGDSNDYYRVRLDQPGQFSLFLSGLGANVNAQLLNQQGAVIETARRRGNAVEAIDRPLAAGIYHIRVFQAGPAGSRYRLQLDSAGATPFPQIALTKQLGGFKQPVYITSARDGSRRLFVVEQPGQIRVVQRGKTLAQPFLDIRDRISTGGEQGLLSLAFPANYAAKKQFYVYYTNRAGDIVIARYRLTADANVADPNSEQIVLTVPHPNNTNHNGGQIAFGGDGYLYIGTGDGGGGGDPANNAQNPSSLLGKILRLDVESSGNQPYRVPSSNPFVGKKDAGNQYRDEIWALGLRNPWRFSFDRQTSHLYIGDVGQNAYEEVNFQSATSPGGENYGWNLREGNFPFRGSTADPSLFVAPVAEYDHTQGRSVTGGFVYRGPARPLQGTYFYGDFVTGKIWGLKRNAGGWNNQLLLDASPSNLSTFGEDEQGNLYVADFGKGDIYRITSTSSARTLEANHQRRQ